MRFEWAVVVALVVAVGTYAVHERLERRGRRRHERLACEGGSPVIGREVLVREVKLGWFNLLLQRLWAFFRRLR